MGKGHGAVCWGRCGWCSVWLIAIFLDPNEKMTVTAWCGEKWQIHLLLVNCVTPMMYSQLKKWQVFKEVSLGKESIDAKIVSLTNGCQANFSEWEIVVINNLNLLYRTQLYLFMTRLANNLTRGKKRRVRPKPIFDHLHMLSWIVSRKFCLATPRWIRRYHG